MEKIKKRIIDGCLILGFNTLMILLLISSITLYLHIHALSPSHLFDLYAGNESLFIAPKTFEGILKTFSPHMLAMPLVFFILFHLAIVSKIYTRKQIILVGILGTISLVGDIFINFFIHIHLVLAYLKFLFFILFEGVMFYIIMTFFYTLLFKK